MENWIGAIVILAIVVGIILFFAPIIIICQLSGITNLLRQIGSHMDANHEETIDTLNGTVPDKSTDVETNNKNY